ncbi:MAG: site-specific integrase [Ktedonobacteraceae bacterium]|nr:site-specific integrase [Ktedonobacteraceae bacterium]
MKRRGNNEGSITKRPDGRWMARVSMPDGSRRVTYGKTKTEVQEKLKDLLKQADHAARFSLGYNYRTIGDFFEAWQVAVSPSVKPKTAQYYANYLRRYTGDLQQLTLTQLKPQHLQKLYASLLAKGLSSTTVRHLHAVLHRAFASAVKQGIFVQNMCDLVDAPRIARTEMHVFNAEQAKRFLAAIQGNRYEALFALALGTGMRQGELLGLTWENVDLDKGIVYVQRNMQWINKTYLLQEPKTNKSRRMIFVGPFLRDILVSHKERQHYHMQVLGESWKPSPWKLVFTNSTGGVLHPSPLVHHNFEPILVKAGLPKIRFHDLRHSAATLLLEAGINPKVVSEMLGHSSVSITLSLYAHVTPAMHYTASLVMDKLLRGEINPMLSPGEENNYS